MSSTDPATQADQADRAGDGRGLRLAIAALVVLLLVAGVVRLSDGGAGSDDGPGAATEDPSAAASRTPDDGPSSGPTSGPAPDRPPAAPLVPAGDQARAGVFAKGRFLVAYYGTAGTGALGVLGETTPAQMHRRLVRAAAPFRREGHAVQQVYELIVTIADATPGPDGDYSHDLARAEVQRYIDAAHRNRALLLLDVQPGRTPFPEVARRWAWALQDPYVGLALDPEWRMHGDDVPGQVVGHVSAAEVNATTRWLQALTARQGLAQKLLVLHQFRTDMIRDIAAVKPRDGLAMVQHVDGFGTPGQKRDTYAAVARPRQFVMGFKLFYDEDVNRLGPAAVHALRPTVRFVSFQ